MNYDNFSNGVDFFYCLTQEAFNHFFNLNDLAVKTPNYMNQFSIHPMKQ